MRNRLVRCLAPLAVSLVATGATAQAVNDSRPPSLRTESAALPAGDEARAVARDRSGVAEDPITVVGRRTQRQSIAEVFERNLQARDPVRFVSSDLGDGRRCTLVLPHGYKSCTGTPSAFVFPLG